MIEFLASYPLLTLLANVTGICGFIFGFFFYFRSKEKYSLSYQVTERQLIAPSRTLPFDMDLPLILHGQELSQLTRTYVLVTNTGNKLIESTDIVGTASVRVGEGFDIISVRTIHADDPGTQALVAQSPKGGSPLLFEYLRPKDAFIFKVDHTGPLNNVFVECRTKAGGPIKKTNPNTKYVIITFLGLLAVGCLGNIVWRYIELKAPFEYDSNDFIFIVLGSLFLGFLFASFVVFAVMLPYSILRYFIRKNHQPKRASLVFLEISANSKNAF